MNKRKLEIKAFHFFNAITWFLAFLLFDITQRAKPQDIDMFNYGIKDQLSRDWDIRILLIGRWILLALCIVCALSFIANIFMAKDTEKKFSKSQLIITLLTIWFTAYYFSNFPI